MQDHLVITPNILAAQAFGVPALSLDALGGRVLEMAGRHVATELIADSVLRGVIQDVLEPLDLDSPYETTSPLISELLRVGVESADLQKAAGKVCSRLAQVLDVYRGALADRGVIASSAKLWEAASLGSRPNKLFVLGYPRIGRADLFFLDAISADGSVLVLPDSAHDLFDENRRAATFLEERGWHVEADRLLPTTLGEWVSECYVDPTAPVPNITAQVYSDREGEVRGTLGRVKYLLRQGVLVEEIVLVARREADYGPTIVDVAQEYDVPVRLAYPVALVETRLGAWLDLLTHVIRNEFPYEATARLFKHPLAPGLESGVWAHARNLLPNDAAAWTRIEVDVSELVWPPEATRAAFRRHLNKALVGLDVMRRAEDDLQASRVLALLEQELTAMPGDEHLPLAAFLAELRDLLGRLTVPFHAAPSGVALHTPLALFGSRFRHVFVLGLAEGVLPQALQDPPLLDFHERSLLAAQGLALETAAERADRERLSVWALLETVTEHLTLSYPQQSDGGANIESAVFAALGCRPLPASTAYCASVEEVRRDRLLDEEATTDGVLTAARRNQQIELRRESAAAHDAFDGVLGIQLPLSDYTFSATGLTRIGLCPFRWFAGNVLGLKELEEAETDLSPRLRGEFYHLALELAVKAAREAGGTRADVVAALDTSFTQAEKKLRLSTLPNWSNRRDEHLAFLARAVRDPEFLPDGVEIVAVEEFFSTTWKGLTIRGKVDRVDRTAEGLSVKDYKTSSSKPKGVKNDKGVAKIDVQLPLYIYAAQTQIVPGAVAETMTGHYYSLTRREKRILGHADPDEAALDALAERVKEHLAEGSFPVDPDTDDYACTHCEFELVCRKGPRLNRKRSDRADA